MNLGRILKTICSSPDKVNENPSAVRLIKLQLASQSLITGTFTTELILLAMLNGYKIKEVPINLASREYGSSYIILRKLLFSLILCFGFYFVKRIVRILFKRKLDLKNYVSLR